MKVFHHFSELGKLRRPLYLAIGVFDGVHLGHQALLRAAREDAHDSGTLAVAMTFDPIPARVLRPESAPPLLTSTPHKLSLLKSHGMDVALVQQFDRKFAGLPARSFLQQLHSAIHPALPHGGELREICVGHNFRFGHHRSGDPELILKLGEELGFGVKVIEPIKTASEVISSTAIRRAIIKGNLNTAEKMLGHPYSHWGKVTRGAGRGTSMGFPTANIHPGEELLPPHGVYAVAARLLPDKGTSPTPSFYGVANLGVRPTFECGSTPVLEVHFFDFSKNIYGKPIAVDFLQKLRDEQKFSSVESLKRQIQKDISAAKTVIQKRNKP